MFNVYGSWIIEATNIIFYYDNNIMLTDFFLVIYNEDIKPFRFNSPPT